MLRLRLVEFDNEERDVRMVSNRRDFGGLMDEPESRGKVGEISHNVKLFYQLF